MNLRRNRDLQSIHKCRRLPKKKKCAKPALQSVQPFCKRCAVPFASSSLSSTKEKLANKPHSYKKYTHTVTYTFKKNLFCLYWMVFLIIIIIGRVSTVFVSANLALLQHKYHTTWRMFAVSIKCRKLSLMFREIALGATRVDFYVQPVEQW